MKGKDLEEMEKKVEEANRPLPYTIRKKKIYKGKMAPAGCMYVVVKGGVGFKGLTIVEAYARVRGSLSPEAEKELCEDLWKLINEQHKSE